MDGTQVRALYASLPDGGLQHSGVQTQEFVKLQYRHGKPLLAQHRVYARETDAPRV